uniref:Non-specific lipid-transfer protein AKCS9 n=1 Tax=Cajanus cajan TaxID=3821 RepID=A0A151U324_CAJCA|nr:putative non-specific lipid-transfer protein AKCS9 [Cajanus cajan]
MVSLFPVEAVEVAEAPVAEAPVAESCNVMELVPCADAFTSITPPSPECCQRLKEQPPPCICLYMNDPTLKGFINTPNAKMVSDTCGSPMPNNC